MAAILSKNISNPDRNVWISNGPVFEWLGPSMSVFLLINVGMKAKYAHAWLGL